MKSIENTLINNFSFKNNAFDNINDNNQPNKINYNQNNTNQNFSSNIPFNKEIIKTNNFINEINKQDIFRGNSRNTLPNYKNITDSNFVNNNNNVQDNRFQQQKLQNNINPYNGIHSNEFLHRRSSNSLRPIKEIDNEDKSNSLNKPNFDNYSENYNGFSNPNQKSNLIKQNIDYHFISNFDNQNRNFSGLNSINNNINDFNTAFNPNYIGLDSVNASNNVKVFGDLKPSVNKPFLNNKEYSFGLNPHEKIPSNIPSVADFNRETTTKNLKRDSNKNLDNINLNSYPNVDANLFNVNIENQNKLNNQINQNMQKPSQYQGNVTNYNTETYKPIFIQDDKHGPLIRLDSQNIKNQNLKENKNNSNNNLIDINLPFNNKQIINNIQSNINNDFENISRRQSSKLIPKLKDDSIINIRHQHTNKSDKNIMVCDDERNIPYSESVEKNEQESIFRENRNYFIGVFLFGLMIISLVGLNNARIVDLGRFANRSLEVMGNLTFSNITMSFDALITFILDIIKQLLVRILALTSASIWENIYLIVFLLMAFVIIRHIYLKVHYKKIANEIYEIIKSRLREMRRENLRNFRSGIRVDDFVNEFSQLHNINPNTFREYVLPILKNKRSKDEDIRVFGELEGGKYFDKWQFKGL